MGIKNSILTLLLSLGVSVSAYGIPTLQLGIPDGSGGYVANQTINSDEDTAFTTKNPFTLAVGGIQSKSEVVQLGGQYTTATPLALTGDDWSDFGLPNIFNGKGAILVASVPDRTLSNGYSGTISTNLKVDGNAPFYADEANSWLQGNHFPAKDGISDFFFFNIGNLFTLSWSANPNPPTKKQDIIVDNTTLNSVPDFQNLIAAPNNKGVIKEFMISGLESFDWVHFDVIALESAIDIDDGRTKTTVAKVDAEINPFSHDVTWYEEDGDVSPTGIPEPASLGLLGLGLLAMGAVRQRRVNQV